MARGLRQLKIIDIVNSNNIETQQELTDLLTEAGFESTQATISRDIKELGIVKIMTPNRKFRYVYGHAERAVTNKFGNLFRESVLSIKSAQNIICIKTMTGSANTAAAFIDTLSLEEIIGSIAGDDTVMLVCSSDSVVESIIRILQSYLD